MRAADNFRAAQLAGLLVDRMVGLSDQHLLFLRGVEINDLVGYNAVLDDSVRRRDEAEIGDLGVAGERTDQADVRAFRSFNRAHPAVVGRVHVAHLDRCALARKPTGTKRRQAAAMRKARERVRLIHELTQLRGAKELLQRSYDRADVDDRLRRDRVLILGRQAFTDDALHAVKANAESVLNQLANSAQAAVAEVLVFVEVVDQRLARQRLRLSGVVLDLNLIILWNTDQFRQQHELFDQRNHVFDRQRAGFKINAGAETGVEFVAANTREVVALGVEEHLVEQRLGGLNAWRLAWTLLLEQFNQAGAAVHLEALNLVGQKLRQLSYLFVLSFLPLALVVGDPCEQLFGGLFVKRSIVLVRCTLELLRERLNALEEVLSARLSVRRVGGNRVADVARVLKNLEQLIVGETERAQQHRDRQLALTVDTDEDLALLVDLELQP